MSRIHFKTCFVTRSSEKPVVKAAGEKGSEECWSTSRTFFADNADPRALQPIVVERGFGMGSKHPRKGFTLIELLVVIAIIALLMAILIPSLNRARKQAKFIACKANLKSYGMMAFMYADDCDGVMPNAWTSFYSQRTYRNEPHRYCRWHNPDWDLEKYPKYAGPFWPYLKGKDIHICPSFPRIADMFGPIHPEHVEGVPIKPNYNYSMNSYLSDKKIISIKHHAEIFFFGEENLWITSPYNSYAFNDTAMCVHERWDSFGTFHLSRGSDMEDGVVNAVFLDGQVKTVNRVDSWRYCAPDGKDLSPLGN